MDRRKELGGLPGVGAAALAGGRAAREPCSPCPPVGGGNGGGRGNGNGNGGFFDNRR